MPDAPHHHDAPVRMATTMTDSPTGARDLPAQSWAELPGGVVDGGEIILLAIKPSMWRPAVDSGVWVVAACLAAALVAWFEQPLPGLSVTASAQATMLLGAVPLTLAILRWIATWYVLTNRRVLTVEGVRAPRIRACLLVDLRNTYLHAEPAERLLGVGTITLVSSRAEQPPQFWRTVARPVEVHERIRRAIEQAIDQQHGSPI